MAITATTQNFDSIIANDLAVIDYWATWCPPCRAFGPIFERVSNDNAFKQVTFAKVDIDQEGAIASEREIVSIPTLEIFKSGELVFSQAGALGERDLKFIIAQFI